MNESKNLPRTAGEDRRVRTHLKTKSLRVGVGHLHCCGDLFTNRDYDVLAGFRLADGVHSLSLYTLRSDLHGHHVSAILIGLPPFRRSKWLLDQNFLAPFLALPSLDSSNEGGISKQSVPS
jgi:hypothetical protein